jgi:FkbM family methyltransferase
MMARTNLFSRIIAFEADPLNFRQLCANLLLNDPQCLIEPRFIAVSDNAGEITYASSLHHPDGNRGGVGVNEGASIESADTILVKTEKVETLIPLKGRRIVAKIDVEGHEPRVLAGMTQLLAENEMLLQIETFYKLQDVKDILEPLGYRAIHRIKDDYFFTNFEREPV